MATLVIGAIEIPARALLEFTQTYRERQAVDLQRTADGTGIVRSLWTGKLGTTIAAIGWAPGFDEFEIGASYEVQCVTPRTASDATTTVAIPPARRNDAQHQPIGFAVVDGELVSTAITNLAALNAGSSDAASLAAVSGASSYCVNYWPSLAMTLINKTSSGTQAATFNWSLEFEAL